MILAGIAAFAISHFFSLWYNRDRDFKDQTPNIGTMMFYPYLRIVPMHLVILTANILGSSVIFLFMILKTIADAGMHIIEHTLFQRTR